MVRSGAMVSSMSSFFSDQWQDRAGASRPPPSVVQDHMPTTDRSNAGKTPCLKRLCSLITVRDHWSAPRTALATTIRLPVPSRDGRMVATFWDGLPGVLSYTETMTFLALEKSVPFLKAATVKRIESISVGTLEKSTVTVSSSPALWPVCSSPVEVTEPS